MISAEYLHRPRKTIESASRIARSGIRASGHWLRNAGQSVFEDLGGDLHGTYLRRQCCSVRPDVQAVVW